MGWQRSSMKHETLKTLSRRDFLRMAGAVGVSTVFLSQAGCRPDGRKRDWPGGKKVVVIGFDGMDPQMCQKLIDEGRLPNLARMHAGGGFSPLGTSIPPQSPVAWANFITGAGPGVHGIFDFVHRDPTQQCMPFYSAAQTIGGNEGWEVGDHKIPLTMWPFNHEAPQTVLRRKGTPFWDYLDAEGIPVQIYDIPSNYPPSPSDHQNMCCLSGMGVPDMLGTYGTYQFFSEKLISEIHETGGVRKPLIFEGNTATAVITGPENSYLKQPQPTEVRLKIHRHPDKKAASIELPDQQLVLKQGEWSDWCRLEFNVSMPSFIPDSSVTGICRFYIKEVHPFLKIYCSPINIDPSNPKGQNISEPPSFVEEISDEMGLFYTTGFQEDHKALSNGIFTEEEYYRQANYVMEERLKLLSYALDRYDDGLLFFYFSSTDLQAHMFYWDSDEEHPVRDAAEAKKYHGVLEELYTRMDGVVGSILDRYGDDTSVFVLSDHGFCTFRRQFNLNTWLREEGYLQPANCTALLGNPTVAGVVPPEWQRTYAYGLGLNGLYLNLRGRERDGIVDATDKDAMLDEITQKLLAIRDPENGAQVISSVYRTDEVYSGPEAEHAPDLIIGYNRGYRSSWDNVLGDIPDDQVICDNRSAWSADHCMDTEKLPGVLFSNRPLARENPSLIDLAPTILEEFGLSKPKSMTGGSVFRRA
jgi:predicted AlkP superfamily phosphohydrolase/phosphomutase